MSDPVIAQMKPFVMEMEPGTYWWCRCGKSATQPFCDGSHRGSEFTPVRFEVTERRTIAWCGCKHTAGQPTCDGAHKKL